MEQKKTAKPSAGKGFLAFLTAEANRQHRSGHICLANNYRSAGNSFARFLQTRQTADVALKALTPPLLADYEAYLQTCGLCKNTTSFYVRALQAVYHKAVRQQLTEDRAPFAGIYRGVARTVKRAIDRSDVCRLKTLDIKAKLVEQGYQGKSLGRRLQQLELARDIFIFSFCARGLTFVDLAHLRKTDVVGKRLVYVRRKTKQRIEVQMEPIMQEIVERHPSGGHYLLPILSRQDDPQAAYRQYRYALARHNAFLSQLGEMLGGLKLTSYVSRHSWASVAHQLHVPLSVISQSMGHDSEKTTEIYLKSLSNNVINRANHDLLRQVFRKKAEAALAATPALKR